VADLMIQKNGTSAEWAADDDILDAGQLGVNTDTGVVKVGDGSTAWSGLSEIGGGGGGGGGTGDPVDDPAEWGTDLGYDAEWASGDPAVPTGWAWVNQGTATATNTFGRCLIDEPTAASGNQLRMIEQAIPSAGSFTATVKLTGRVWPAAGTFGHFMHLRDSAGGKIVTFGLGGAGASTWGWNLWNWASASGASPATVVSTASDAVLLPKFWRIRKNSATSWDFQASRNGVVWDTVQAAHNVQTYLTTAPTHIGFGLWRNNVLTSASADWFRIR
jgi:hypothetical protein